MLNESLEKSLIERFQQGDESAFGDLFNAFHRNVVRIALNVIRDEEAALDVAQEVFMRGYKELSGWRGEARLSTWLYRATVNVCFERLRLEEKHRRIRDANHRDLSAPAVDDIVSENESVALIDRAIQQLPPRQRAAFILRHYQDMKFQEVASVLEISTEGAKANYHKALLTLRELLSPRFCTADSQ
jgi:RNA polymerase sigma-70 factor, ECF subfamily